MQKSICARCAKCLIKQLGDLELNGISIEDVQAHLKGKRGGPITRFWFMKYHALDRFFLYAVSRRYMEHGALLPTTQPKKPASLIPYLYSVEEVRRLLSVGDACYQPTSPLEPHTMRTLLLLLYGAGLRICEALKLTLANMNLNDGLLTIRQSKFLKSRLVPIGCDLTEALQVYYERQWAASDPGSDSPLPQTRPRVSDLKNPQAFGRVRLPPPRSENSHRPDSHSLLLRKDPLLVLAKKLRCEQSRDRMVHKG